MTGFGGPSSVSILMFVRNGGASAERAARSVLGQSWTNLELVVQDGGSQDGTAERLAALDDRVHVVSEPDDGPADGFWRALERCRGEIIGSCLADEALEPGALRRVVAHFRAHPGSLAVTGDALACDLDHNPIRRIAAAPVRLLDLSSGRQMPYFSASFFRAAALHPDDGLEKGDWTPECLEFEIWLRLAIAGQLDCMPEILSRYAWHDGQLSNQPGPVLRHARARIAMLGKAFTADGLLGDNPTLRDYCQISQLETFRDHLLARGHRPAAAELTEEMAAIRRRAGGDPLALRSRGDNLARAWSRVAYATPGWLRDRLGPKVKGLARVVFFGLGRMTHSDGGTTTADPLASFERDLGQIYETRGLIAQALACYRRAFDAGDADAGSLACQAMLKLPGATEADQRNLQEEWARRHALPMGAMPPLRPLRRNGRITVGYVASVWNSPYVRHQVVPLVAAHDRRHFRVIGYAGLRDAPEGVEFDAFRWVGNLDDRAFAAQVREDGVDVLVEVNGFSPGHRFAALGARLAPVQISYINHNGTSGVPNVDWVLADAIAAPAGIDGDYSEGVWRLPGCFVCFDYQGVPPPRPSPLPMLAAGRPTFGCLGSAGKINHDVIAVWADLLHAVPDARLLLRNGGLSAAANRRDMAQRFRAHGITPDRLDLRPGAPRDVAMADYREIDVSLDTFPYCGGNTIAESFWHGVPVVSLTGQRFAATYGASILAAGGCAGLAVASIKDYVAAAAGLTATPEQLAALRAALPEQMQHHGLSDSVGLTKQIEVAYSEMLSRTEKSPSGSRTF